MTNIMTPGGAGTGAPEMDDAHEPASNVGTKGQGKTDSRDCAQAAAQRKRFATLQARAALASVTATLTESDDGRMLIVVSRWALCRSFASLDELEDWLDRIGAPG